MKCRAYSIHRANQVYLYENELELYWVYIFMQSTRITMAIYLYANELKIIMAIYLYANELKITMVLYLLYLYANAQKIKRFKSDARK